jgi:hypothetical protein
MGGGGGRDSCDPDDVAKGLRPRLANEEDDEDCDGTSPGATGATEAATDPAEE